MKINIKDLKKAIVPAIVIIILLVAAGALYYFSQKSKNILKPQDVAAKAINFINENYLKGQTAAVLGAVSEKNGVYEIKFSVENQEYIAYATRDGKILFPPGAAVLMSDENSASNADIPKKDISQALLFVMSFCPYGNQAEEIMMNVVDLLGDKADIQLHYVIYSNYQGGGSQYCLDKENKYCSMHGIQELNQDVRELCVQKYQGDKFWNFVKQINASCTAQNVDTCWEAVAQKSEVNVNKVKTCQTNEVITLLKNEVELGEKYGISGSPQLVINDKEFNGARTAEGYKAAICSGFNTAPAECSTSLGTDSGTTSTGGCE